MTDYRLKTEKSKKSEKKEKLINNKRVHAVSEINQGLISKNQESEALVSKFRDVTNKYRADIVAKDPSTFAFYGSAKSYYEDSFYNIINYYPYDGTKKEVLEWYENVSPLDVALLQNHWPSFVGHLNLNEDEFVSFYAGPQEIDEITRYGQQAWGETGLRLDPEKGNTVEFWLKKDGWSASQEVVFDIGSYPGKASASNVSQFKLYLSNSSGSPLYIDYTLGALGVSDQNIGSSNITTSSIGDSAWHHYALKVYQENTTLYMKLYIDGEHDSTTTASVAAMTAKDTYMGGAIGAAHGASSGSLSGSVDEFRFWKGQRTSKQISRFFDQKLFASETTEETYTSRLGLYYRFNKPAIGVISKDQIVLDYSGNDITGLINNYNTSVRVAESGITNSSVSLNTELKDPSLDAQDNNVIIKKQELLKIGESYDINNPSYIRNFVPEWVFDNSGQGLSNENSQVSILFQLMASEFDQIRINLDAIMKEKTPRFERVSQDVLDHEDTTSLETSSSYSDNYFLGCDDNGSVYLPSWGNHSGFPIEKIENIGINVIQKPLINAEMDEELDRVINHISITKPIEEVRRAILENVYSSAKHILKRKGTERGFDSILSSYGIDRDLVSYNVYGRNTETFIDDNKTDFVSDEKNSVYFGQNTNSTIFLSGTGANERTYLEGDSVETEYTFEGTFIFPERRGAEHVITNSSIFGLAEVAASNNDLTFSSPNNADFQVKVVKDGIGSDDAKFTLTSVGGIISDLETDLFKDVYKNSRWNIALRVIKDADNKFVSASAPSYKVELVGHNYILDSLQNSFTLTSSLSTSEYEDFRSANKTIYLGAQRTNITGSVVTSTDIKVINFNAWNDDLTDLELQNRAKSPSITGRRKSHAYRDNYDASNDSMDENKILSLQFDAVSDLNSNNDIVVADATSGSADQVIKYGALVGNKYPAKSTTFSSGLTNVVQREFLPVIRNIPLGNVHGEQGVEVKDAEINKFDLSSRPQGKLFSFEKSMYHAISREMVNFLGGMTSFNNLIGEPVYKYRKNYKMLDHLRQKFYETVENENQFERFVSYFRWIDKSVGHFLEQLVPATATTNAGIEDVVESHTLERNKYDHKLARFERKEPNLDTSLLAINELLYDWEHGHYSSDEDEHCLWQQDRKERTGDRETLRKVLTTVVSGSTYVLRNLVKPYRYTVDKQTLLNIGSNRNANKNRDLYKIINEGKEITIAADDIYQFKQCNDVINPQEEKLYTAKTNTTTTDDYLDADADMILPFSLYSSSVGEDFADFKQNLKITNNHDDVPALQSPFVKEFVGGLPHRNVKFGTADADRPEAYDISSSATTFTIKQTTAPKSMFHRDLGGARFYHIGNVKTTEAPLVIGNYSKEYEIVMTNGRSLNNNYLVENEGLNLTGALVASLYISGAADFYVPERTARDHVIVNRFAAPGGPEQAGVYGLDREAAEYSIYNTVNYRNPIVRDVENLLSAEHSEQFGYRSGSAVQASKHMTNRNPRKFTGSLGEELNYDNNFVQHEIPQTDFGYAWVSASANESVYSFLNKNENAGHQHLYNISGTLKSSETIVFLAKGEYPAISGISGGDEVYWLSNPVSPYGVGDPSYISESVSFVNLNSVIVEPVDATNNLLGFSSITLASAESTETLSTIASNAPILNSSRFKVEEFGSGNFLTAGWKTTGLLNSIILNRQGPYGWPTWKQIRGEQHPITRNHRKNNKLSIVYRNVSGRKYAFTDSIKGDYDFDYKESIDNNKANTSARLVESYSEMFVTSKFNPLNVNLTSFKRDGITLQNLDKILRIASRGMEDRKAKQVGEFLMWMNDEYYLSNTSRTASDLISGLSTDTEDKLMFAASENDVLSQEQQEMLADAIGVLRNSSATSMRASVNNRITGFSQREFENIIIDGNVENGALWTKYIDRDKFSSDITLGMLKNFMTEGLISRLARELNYVETIYPREINTYKSEVRTRSNFDFFGWDSTRTNRNLILSGNVSYGSPLVSSVSKKLFFPATATTAEGSFKTSYYDTLDIVDVNSTGSSASIVSSSHITASTWVLDSRRTFSATPLNITSSFFTDGETFLANRSQGTRGEGILQNDYSIFGMGYNGLRGAPPMSILYNRRIPQQYGSDVYLAGEAKWEAADTRTGPFYDTYQDYAEGLKNVGQTYSLIPEFRMSRVIEDYLTSKNPADLAPNDFLELTGAVYHTSSGDLSVGTEFFKTYSMTDFMKYFHPVLENIEQDALGLAPAKLTLRCSAVKKFLPYRGFYPAERVVQLSEIFDRSYIKSGTYDAKYIQNSSITQAEASSYLNLRIENSKAQAIKPIMAPGVLLNSIKAGLAVDYPIFQSSVSNGIEYIFENNITSSLNDFSLLSLGPTTAFTGSIVNSTADEGIPRISGSVNYRVTFEDMLYPSSIWGKIVYDNEPHPSASLMFGFSDHLKVVDRPAKFGTVNNEASIEYGAMEFRTSKELFARSMLPFQSAVHNFCAETVGFFLEDGQLNTLTSAPGSQYFDAATYRMRVYLTNEDTTMYDRHSAFGPPVDEGDVEITTYQVSSSVIEAAAATASLGFGSISAPYPDLSGSTITLENTAGTSKTFKFKTEVLEATASASVLYNSSPSGAGVNTLQMSASYEGNADDSKVWSKFSFYNYQFSGSESAQQLIHYDPDDFNTELIKIKFGSGFYTSIDNYLASGSGGPRFNLSGSGGSHVWTFYNSSTSPSVPSNNSVITYFDIWDTVNLRKKTAEEVATEFAGTFTTNAAMSSSFIAIVGTGSSNSNRVHIFSKTRSSNNDLYVGTPVHPNAFTVYENTDTKYLALITTGSGSGLSPYGSDTTAIQAWYHNSTLDGYVQAPVSWADTVAAINNPMINYPYKFVDVGSSATGDDLVNAATASINSWSPSRNVSASAGISNQLIIHRRDAGSQGNHTLNYNSFIGPSVLTNSSIFTSTTNFTGGIDGETFTNASLDGSDVVISVNSGATTANVVASASAAITDVTNGLGSTITTNSTSTSLQLTQSTTGVDGNNTITESGFVSDGGTVSGFAGGVDYEEGVIIVDSTTAIQSSSHGYLPYVPPFLDPNTSPYAELSFTPTREGEYTIDQILENLEITYYNMEAPSNASSNINYQEAMVLSASIDFKGQIKLRSDHVDELVGIKSRLDPETSNLSRWVIRPKWETPVIDFSNVSASALNLSDSTVYSVTGSPWKTRYQSSYYEVLNSSSSPYLTASVGMWHQSGTLIGELADKGYYLVIESGDLGSRDTYAAKDLAKKVGFLTGKDFRKRVKLGKVAESKIVSEAVIAIPFYNDPEEGIKFFDINSEVLQAAALLNKQARDRYSMAISNPTIDDIALRVTRKRYEEFLNTPGTDGVENVAYQLRMMEKFIIPPQFDFIARGPACADVQPFVQYIFQFNTELTSDDLAGMWQNLYPTSQDGPGQASHSSPFGRASGPFGDGLPSDNEFISNFLDVDGVEIFQTMKSNYANVTEFLQAEVRWLVFKAKQRGIADYNELIAKSYSNGDFLNLHSINGREFDYNVIRYKKTSPQFNWPYDYFSLVELGKLESKVDFYDDVNSSDIVTTTSAFTATSEQQGAEPLEFTTTQESTSDSSTSSSSTSVDSFVFREVLLADTTTPSSRIFSITGGTLSAGTEQLYVNGILQSLGAANDYTISGNTITFTYDLELGDSVVVSYVKE